MESALAACLFMSQRKIGIEVQGQRARRLESTHFLRQAITVLYKKPGGGLIV